MNNYKLTGIVLILLINSYRAIAGGATFVGPASDSNCQFNSIQAAFDSGATEIFVSTEMQYNENITVPDTNLDVVIRGGFTDCSTNSFDPALKSTLSGILANLPVMVIMPSTERKSIIIRNMFIVNGTGSGFIPAGGINIPSSNDILTIRETTIALNEGLLGGGIYLSGVSGGDRAVLFLTENSLILNNSSSSETLGGGGIYCENAAVTIWSNSSIKLNTTEGSGGGIYAEECTVSEWSGESINDDPEKGIFGNKANIHGGGIFATNGSAIQLGTANEVAIFFGSVVNNTADNNHDGIGDGGGIYVNDSTVNLFGSIVQSNVSGGNGGGIYAQLNANLKMLRQNDLCWTGYKCNQIIDNQTDPSGGNGGGVYLTNGAFGVIETAYFEGNRGDNGTAIYITSEPSELTISNTTFFNNGNNGSEDFSDNNVIMADNESNIHSIHNTFYNNGETVSTFRNQNDSGLIIQGNIIYSDTAVSAVRTASAISVGVDCVNTNLLPLTGTDVFSAPITYVNEANGDLRLSADDQGAQDKCPDFGIGLDVEGQERPHDNPLLVNLAGSSDVGADELTDLIFANGFE